MSEKEKSKLEQAKEYLDRNLVNVNNGHSLAKKFCNTYKTINEAPVLLMTTPAGVIWYDDEHKIIIGSDGWEGEYIDEDSIKDLPIVTKSRVFKYTESEMGVDVSDEVIIQTVYDELVKLDNELSMDVYHIFSILRSPILRYKSELGMYETEGQAKMYEDEYPYTKIDTPYSHIMLRYNRKKLWP